MGAKILWAVVSLLKILVAAIAMTAIGNGLMDIYLGENLLGAVVIIGLAALVLAAVTYMEDQHNADDQ